MAKKQLYNYSFESNKANGGKFTKICEDMMCSKAWSELSVRETGLYLAFKRKFTVYSNKETNEKNISMPWEEINKNLGYGNRNTYNKDLDSLIEKGFIKYLFHGKAGRSCNIYAFSDKWKVYGTEEFKLHPNDIRNKS